MMTFIYNNTNNHNTQCEDRKLVAAPAGVPLGHGEEFHELLLLSSHCVCVCVCCWYAFSHSSCVCYFEMVVCVFALFAEVLRRIAENRGDCNCSSWDEQRVPRKFAETNPRQNWAERTQSSAQSLPSNKRGAMGSKNPLCILGPLLFSARHGSKNPGFVLRPFFPYAVASLGVA